MSGNAFLDGALRKSVFAIVGLTEHFVSPISPFFGSLPLPKAMMEKKELSTIEKE
jgi:hypothetical protein